MKYSASQFQLPKTILSTNKFYMFCENIHLYIKTVHTKTTHIATNYLLMIGNVSLSAHAAASARPS